MRHSWKILIILPLYITCTGFSYEEKTRIPPHQEKDECIELRSGATLTYQFKTSLSAKFDIHRHVNESEVIVLDKSIGTTNRGPKTVKIDKGGIYCLNWKNRYRDDLILNYRIQFENPNP